MGIKDVGQVSRPGQFSQPYDADTQTTFVPLSGRNGKRIKYRAQGPNVAPNAQPFWSPTSDPQTLRRIAQSEGVLPYGAGGPFPLPARMF